MSRWMCGILQHLPIASWKMFIWGSSSSKELRKAVISFHCNCHTLWSGLLGPKVIFIKARSISPAGDFQRTPRSPLFVWQSNLIHTETGCMRSSSDKPEMIANKRACLCCSSTRSSHRLAENMETSESDQVPISKWIHPSRCRTLFFSITGLSGAS